VKRTWHKVAQSDRCTDFLSNARETAAKGRGLGASNCGREKADSDLAGGEGTELRNNRCLAGDDDPVMALLIN
jgi:hypothetical protein